MAIANFPSVNSEKNTYYLAARGRIDTNASRLTVTSDNQTILGDLLDKPNCWTEVYAKHTSTDGNSTAVGKRLLVLEGLIEAQFKIIFNDIPTSVLNTEDYTVFRFNPGGSSHTHIVAQKIPGVLSVESTHHLGQKIRIKNPLTPESDAMPHGNKARIWTAIMPKKVEASIIEWGNNPKQITTRFHDESFKEERVGQYAAYKTCYENPTGEQGDHSEPLWVLIS